MKLQLTLICIAFTILSCKKNADKTANYTIEFQTQVNSTNIGLNTNFSDASGKDIKVEVMQFYLAEMYLVTDDGEECLVEDLALVQLDNNGFASLNLEVIAGKYSALKFDIGVPKELNDSDPAAFNEPDHPLHITQNTYWGWASKYRFLTLEGRYDIEPDGTPDGTFAYHTGYDESYVNTEFTVDFNFKKDESYSSTLCIDFNTIFDNGANSVDITTESNYHGNYDEVELSVRVSNNFKDALTLK